MMATFVKPQSRCLVMRMGRADSFPANRQAPARTFFSCVPVQG
jgi:hypothetical protein